MTDDYFSSQHNKLCTFQPVERALLHTKYYFRVCTVLCILAQRNDAPIEKHSRAGDVCTVT
jgi:hypothetical protein